MFAINDRITARQLYYQIVMSMVGVFLVFLPGYHYIYGWVGAGCCLGAFLVWIFYSFFLVRISSSHGHLEKVLGTWGKKAYGTWMILFFIVTGAFLTSLIYEVIGTHFVTGASPYVIHAVILLACVMAGIPQIQRRGRMAEVCFPILVGLVVLLLAVSCWQQIKQSNTFALYLRQEIQIDANRFIGGVYVLFAVSAGLWGLPFLLNNVKDKRWKSILSAYGTLLLLLLAVLLLLQGSYGTRQVQERKWPVVSLMGGVRIPGGFVFRIDPLWIGILLLLLLFSVGSTLFYGNYIAGVIEVNLKWYWIPVIVYIVSLVQTNMGSIRDYYDQLLLYIFCPVMVLFHLIIGWRGRKHRV